jgi:hypothetical protein
MTTAALGWALATSATAIVVTKSAVGKIRIGYLFRILAAARCVPVLGGSGPWSRNPAAGGVNLKNARVVFGHHAFAPSTCVACRVLIGNLDTFVAEVEFEIGGVDRFVLRYIVAEAPDDVAARATDGLSGAHLEHGARGYPRRSAFDKARSGRKALRTARQAIACDKVQTGARQPPGH